MGQGGLRWDTEQQQIFWSKHSPTPLHQKTPPLLATLHQPEGCFPGLSKPKPRHPSSIFSCESSRVRLSRGADERQASICQRIKALFIKIINFFFVCEAEDLQSSVCCDRGNQVLGLHLTTLISDEICWIFSFVAPRAQGWSGLCSRVPSGVASRSCSSRSLVRSTNTCNVFVAAGTTPLLPKTDDIYTAHRLFLLFTQADSKHQHTCCKVFNDKLYSSSLKLCLAVERWKRHP